MVTAADGAENFYKNENNVVRYVRIIIDNSGGGFEENIDTLKRIVDRFIGEPVSLKVFIKYLVKNISFHENLDHAILMWKSVI